MKPASVVPSPPSFALEPASLAGREFASLMNQRRGGSDGGSYGNVFGVGGRLYGRTWGTGLVADPNNGTGGTGGTGGKTGETGGIAAQPP